MSLKLSIGIRSQYNGVVIAADTEPVTGTPNSCLEQSRRMSFRMCGIFLVFWVEQMGY